jgi:hypothetical protein
VKVKVESRKKERRVSPRFLQRMKLFVMNQPDLACSNTHESNARFAEPAFLTHERGREHDSPTATPLYSFCLFLFPIVKT